MVILVALALSAPVQTPPPPAEPAAPPASASVPDSAEPAAPPASASVSDADEPPRVYIMDLASDTLAPETARGLSSLIAQNMRSDAFNVLTAGDVASVLDLEAEKPRSGAT